MTIPMKSCAFALFIAFVACSGGESQPSGDARAGDGELIADQDSRGDSAALEEALYVHAADGEDVPEAGGPEAPFRTIQYAIDQASPPVSVRVAAGDYNESVILAPGVSLLGGFAADDWGDRNVHERDDPRYRTSIRAFHNIAITAGKDVTRACLIEGFDIHGGVDTLDHHSYGLYLFDGGSPTIRFNTIEGGTGDMYGNGIGLFDSDAHIIGNTIRGGSSQLVYGVRATTGSAPLIVSNVIRGDSATDISYGIVANSSSPVIINNTIDGGSAGNESYAIFNFSNAQPIVENNILLSSGGTSRYCIYEFSFNCRPASLRGNDFADCPTGLYRAFGSAGLVHDVESVNGLSDTDASDNIAADPVFVSGEDFHLQASSPLVVREGAVSPSFETSDYDHDGSRRTSPWSIGAFEYDGE